ncbi:N-acetylneuraminate lyase isoform X1 [Nasonia vitripennis]|uniref:N-acetylneuraminate lyase n=1 Tax=Nasonia vitripennis TaxID=7425 RepID=A0A7M7G6S3_NASVI|nr:N-acetylneuraminate lyase isoform X1 [Nasonia vitripennis]
MSMNIFVYSLFLVGVSTAYSIVNSNENIAFKFQGLMAPVFTPFNNDENRTLNLAIIPEYAKFLASKNISGILIGGTTGEGTSLTINERKQLAEAWAKAVNETKQHLMVQIGGTTLVDVKELAAHAENLKVDSLLCLPDLYFKPSNTEDLIEYLSIVSQSAPNTPLLYYQSTKAKTNIRAGEFLKSVGNRIPTLVGVKLDSSDIKEGIDALATSNRFVVFYGSKMVISAGCVIGVKSFMSATLNFIPNPSFKLMEFCEGHANLKTAMESQSYLNEIEKNILQHGGYVETMKTAMTLLSNLSMGPPRAPLKLLSKESVDAMSSGLSKIGLKINGSIAFSMS